MSFIDNDYQEENEVVMQRPTGLTILCLLTFINSGIMFLSDILVFSIYQNLPNIVEQFTSTMPTNIGDAYAEIVNAYALIPQYAYLMLACIALLAVVGAGAMMKMRRIGFHLYTAAQLAILVMPAILSKNAHVDFISVSFTLIFIALYAIYYKKMR